MDLLVEILEHAQSYRTCKESMHNSSLAIWVGYSQSRRFAHDFNSLLNVVLGMLRSSREQVEGCVADKYLVHVQLIVKGISYLGFLGDQGLYSALARSAFRQAKDFVLVGLQTTAVSDLGRESDVSNHHSITGFEDWTANLLPTTGRGPNVKTTSPKFKSIY